MQQVLRLWCAATLGLLLPAFAADKKVVTFSTGTPVVVVGQITSPPKGVINEKKMQVGIGPTRTDYTLHFRNAELVGLHGQKIDEGGFNDGMWVRAEGRVAEDRRRIDVTRVQIIAPDTPGHKRSAFYRSGFDHGYITSVAGERQIFPDPGTAVVAGTAPFTVVGRVSSDTGPFESTRKIQVKAAGNEWTLHVPKESAVVDGKGEKISVHEVKRGQWVRAHGWRTDDLRMRVERLENIGPDEAYRAGTYFRAPYPLGYVDVIEGTDRFVPLRVTGSVVRLHSDVGSVVVRDDAGVEHVIYSDGTTFSVGGQPVFFDRLKVGDRIIVEGRTIRF